MSTGNVWKMSIYRQQLKSKLECSPISNDLRVNIHNDDKNDKKEYKIFYNSSYPFFFNFFHFFFNFFHFFFNFFHFFSFFPFFQFFGTDFMIFPNFNPIMVIIEKMAGSIVQCKKTKKSQIMIENYEMFSNSYISSNSYSFLNFLL